MAVAQPEPAGEAKASLLLRLRATGIRDLSVLRAMEAVPRGRFLPPASAGWAMRNIAVPIPCGQTSPRPSVVARLLESLSLKGGERVLEIGSGSGYVTALLASLGAEVEGVERYRTLAGGAAAVLAELDLRNATVAWGDGLAAGQGPYDRIVVHAELASIPAALVDRLAPEGRVSLVLAGPRPMLVTVRREAPEVPQPICPASLPPLQHGVSLKL